MLCEFVKFMVTGSIPSNSFMATSVFFLGAATMAILVFMADYLFYSIYQRSLLEMGRVFQAGPIRILRTLLAWVVVTVIVAFLGEATGILQASRQSAVFVSISWPLLLAKVIQSSKERV